MKRRRFLTVSQTEEGYIAICEEHRAWHKSLASTRWYALPELPPIEEPPNEGLLTREQTDMARLPENQPSSRPIAWCRSDDYQKSSEKLQSFSGWTEQHSGLDMPLYAEPQITYQGLGRQDLPIRDWANLAAKVDRAERVLLNSITNTNIDVGCVLRSLIGEIRDELGLPKPSEAAK
jgi:hypothetical protein